MIDGSSLPLDLGIRTTAEVFQAVASREEGPSGSLAGK